MMRNRIILLVAGIIAVILLWQLPKKSLKESTEGSFSQTPVPPETPNRLRINRLKAKLNLADSLESAIFADSLSALYAQAMRKDSAAWFAEVAATFLKTPEAHKKAGDLYYEYFQAKSSVPAEASRAAESARNHLRQAIGGDSTAYDTQAKIAMTYLASAPMIGVRMLKDIVSKDPKNIFALYNLAALSLQSGQSDKAMFWLNRLLEIQPDDDEGLLLLGATYLDMGQPQKALLIFRRLKETSVRPSIQQEAEDFLKKIEK